MTVFNRDSWKPLIFPAGVALVVAALLLHSEMLAISNVAIASYYYAVFLAGLLLATRFRSILVLFALLVLLLAHRALEFFSDANISAGPGRAAFDLLAVLIPLNFVVLARMRERGMKISAIVPRVALLIAQSIVVTVICSTGLSSVATLLDYPMLGRSASAWTTVPQLAVIVSIAAAAFFATRYARNRKPLDMGFFWSVVAVFFSFHFGGISRLGDGYMATAGLILLASVVETSYVMAYHDELTMLPGRRAFNEALLSLDGSYAIAIVDIDHFKQFNDTYGHDTGDEVLRMVAARLARVTGGGKAFRCGGEEFAILFEGKSAKDAVEDLELLRRLVEGSIFRLRTGQERRQAARTDTADRRKKVSSKTMLERSTLVLDSARDLHVTVSIGVAEPSTRFREINQVIRAADKALYRAKANGRNRVEVATSGRVRTIRARKASA